MKIVKITLGVVFGLAIIAYCYLYAVNNGFERYNLPGTGVNLKIENPFTKDLTFGVDLNLLPTVKIRSGLTTYKIYDDSRSETTDKKVLDLYYESMKSGGGESLAKIRAEIKLLESVYVKIITAELLTTDGTPIQKLLIRQKKVVSDLHGVLAEASNQNLRYGNK